MITFDQFVQKYKSSPKPIDYDNAYGGECLDLIKYLFHEVYWVRPWKIGNADQLFVDKYKFLTKQWFTQIKGSKDLQYWDIIFLKTANIYRHVGIFLEDKWLNVEIFDQIGNGDKVGGELPPRIRQYKKTIVMGAWRLNLNESDIIDKRVEDFAKAHGINPPSKTESYTQYETCIILSKII